jgi:uncharacterized paraquat-inducible protein A
MIVPSSEMVLVCRNCGAVNKDPGGDPREYRCGVCGQPSLERAATKSDKVLATAITGAVIAGLEFGPIGALIGGLAGLLVGDRLFK